MQNNLLTSFIVVFYHHILTSRYLLYRYLCCYSVLQYATITLIYWVGSFLHNSTTFAQLLNICFGTTVLKHFDVDQAFMLPEENREIDAPPPHFSPKICTNI